MTDTRYNTGNPVGSADPRDRDDNTKNLDELVNSTNSTSHPDRQGVPRKTWHGMEQDFQAAQDDKEVRYQRFLLSSGYVGTGVSGAIEDYIAGIRLTDLNQIIRADGELWRVSASATLPYTTTGAGMPEGGKFKTVGDGVLRQELAAAGGAALVGGALQLVDNVADLVTADWLKMGEIVSTNSYHGGYAATVPGPVGGCKYLIVPAGTGIADNCKFIDLLGSAGQAMALFDDNTVDVAQAGAQSSDSLGSQHAALQAALDCGAGHVVGGGRLYKTSEQLTIPSGVRLSAIDIDMSACAGGATGVSLSGDYGTAHAVTSGGTRGTRIITSLAAAQELQDGDVVRLQSSDIYDASNTNSKLGELNIVSEVDAGTGAITLKIPLQSTYITGFQIVKMTMAEGNKFYDVGVFSSGLLENTHTGILIKAASGCNVVNSAFNRLDNRAVAIQDSMYCKVKSSLFKETKAVGTGYGVSFIDATQDCSASDCSFEDVRHSLSTNNTSILGGIPRRILFKGNSVTSSARSSGGSMGGGDAIDTHGAAEEISIINNTVVGSTSYGINIECKSAVVKGNTIRECQAGGICIRNESDFDGDVVCSGNRIEDVATLGIYIYSGLRGTTAKYRSATISGNVIIRPGSMGIKVGYETGRVSGVSVVGNSIYSPASRGVLITDADDCVASSNIISNAPDFGVRVENSKGIAVSANAVSLADGAESAGIYVGGIGSSISVNGNVVTSLGAAAARGVQFSNTITDSMITNNIVAGTTGVQLGPGSGNISANNIE
ncbi:hypothetical protein GCM10022421_31930 [Oceanisphaera sediminis]|uniref:Right handed beta helix domain-containing protein n=1 Tax=Oceanisphaera sediminis TaxID=981381 RepID=A0ABP7EN48_9GAMM